MEAPGLTSTSHFKYVFVYWRPDSIPVSRRMKMGVFEGQLKRLFQPFHAELQASTLEEVGPDTLGDVIDTGKTRSVHACARSFTRHEHARVEPGPLPVQSLAGDARAR